MVTQSLLPWNTGHGLARRPTDAMGATDGGAQARKPPASAADRSPTADWPPSVNRSLTVNRPPIVNQSPDVNRSLTVNQSPDVNRSRENGDLSARE